MVKPTPKSLKKIQERALRFIYNDYNSDYDTLLLNSKMPTLKLRRLRTMALEAFKILNHQGPVYLHDMLNLKKNIIILLGTLELLKSLR